MSGDDRIVNTVHMLHQIVYLRAILRRQAISGRIWDIHYRSPRLDDRFHHTRQIFIIRTSRIFGVKLHILHKAAGIFHSSHRTFYNLLASGIELILDVRVGSTDTRMDTFVLGKSQGFRRHINILLYGACQRTNRGPCHSFWYFNHRIEVARTRNGKSRFNYIHAQRFQLFGHLNLFHCIQLASRNLLTIAERCVENK